MKNFAILASFVLLQLASFITGVCDRSQAALVINDTHLVARQDVILLGINATLVASGPARFTYDVDANNNTIPGGASSLQTLLLGNLPTEFAALGAAGAPFELFPVGPTVVTASNNGTRSSVLTPFGLRVLGPGGIVVANFFTATPSLFSADIPSLNNFGGAVFQADNRPNDISQVFIGDSLIPNSPSPGTLVGISFNRTVTAVPEPSSLLLCSMIALVSCVIRPPRQPIAT